MEGFGTINNATKISSGFLTLFGTSNFIKTVSINRGFDISDIIENPPVEKISIVMPSYNEEAFIEYAAQSIMSQNIIRKYPEKFEFIVADSNSKDNTVIIAEKYADKVIITPRGKLTTRNRVYGYVSGDIIVSVDSDCYYPINYLNCMLKSFKDFGVVGVSGFTIEGKLPYGNLTNRLYPISHYLSNVTYDNNRLYGRCSAYYTDIGRREKFNENINQTDVYEMVAEEEKGFGKRVAKYGKVIFNTGACCFHYGSAKIGCRSGVEYKQGEDKTYCEQIRNKERF